MSYIKSSLKREEDMEYTIRQALLNNEYEEIEFYLAAGGDPDIIIEGEPLILAALTFGSSSYIVDLLLHYGANPNVENGYAIVQASKSGNVENVDLLLEYGVDPSSHNNKALLVAKSPEIRSSLINHRDFNDTLYDVKAADLLF